MRTRLFGAGFVAVAVFAAGCATQADLTGNLAAAAAKTVRGTSRVALVVTIQSPGMSVTLTQTGAFDYAHSTGFLRGGSGTGLLQEVFLPPHIYLQLAPDAGATLPTGKSWLDMNAADMAGSGGQMFAPFSGATQFDPSELLDYLLGVADGVRQLGGATIRGVPTVHYQVPIDLAKAEARAAPAQKAAFAAFAKAFGQRALDAQVWVDGQGLVRRVTVTLAVPKSAGAPAGSRVTETADFYDFGVPVHVFAPPAADILSQPQPGGGAAPDFGQGGDGFPPPPAAAGTLSPADARAAEDAVRALWAGLGANDLTAAARAVVPAQRSCLKSAMTGEPKFKVTSLQIASARPDGTGHATVLFKLDAQVQVPGAAVPVGPPGSGTRWLAAAKIGGHWYVDLQKSTSILPPCPG